MTEQPKTLVLFCDHGQFLWWRRATQSLEALDDDFLPKSLNTLLKRFEQEWYDFESLAMDDPHVADARISLINFGQAVGGCIALWAYYTHNIQTEFELSYSEHSIMPNYKDILQSYTPYTALAYTKLHPSTKMWVESNIEDVYKMFTAWTQAFNYVCKNESFDTLGPQT